MARSSRPLTVTLGDMQARVDERVKSGAYASASEVLREAVRALDREDEHLDQMIRERIQASLDDPRPGIPAEEVFARLRRRIVERAKADKGAA